MAFNHVYNRNRHIKMHKTSTDETGEKQHNASMKDDKINESSSEKQNNLLDDSTEVVSTNDGIFDDNNNAFASTMSQSTDFENIINSNDNSYVVKIESSNGSDNVTSSVLERKPKYIPRIDKKFRCSQCYKRFSSEERLLKHAFIHDESAKKLSCDICKRKFLTNSALSCHIKYHKYCLIFIFSVFDFKHFIIFRFTDEPRKFDCSLCDKVFDSIPLRREHVSVHINPDTGCYHCPKCSKVCILLVLKKVIWF